MASCSAVVMSFWVMDACTTSPGIIWKIPKINSAVAKRTGIVNRTRFTTYRAN
jgi:hypothetical protein